MPARFTAPIKLTAATPLTDVQRARLAVVGPRYFGGKGPANLPASDFQGDPMQSRTLLFCEERRVVDRDRHLFDAWFYMSDTGSFFRAGTAEEVACVIQCGLECPDPELRAILGPAMVQAKLLPRSDDAYEEFAELLAQQGAPRPAPKTTGTRGSEGKLAKATGKKATPKKVATPAKKKLVKKTPAAKKQARNTATKPHAKKTGEAVKKKPAAGRGKKAMTAKGRSHSRR